MSDAKVVVQIAYSTAETHLLKILRRRTKPIDITVLSEMYYDGRDGRDAPFHADKSIRSMIGALEKKIEHNREPFTIEKSDGRPIQFRIVER